GCWQTRTGVEGRTDPLRNGAARSKFKWSNRERLANMDRIENIATAARVAEDAPASIAVVRSLLDPSCQTNDCIEQDYEIVHLGPFGFDRTALPERAGLHPGLPAISSHSGPAGGWLRNSRRGWNVHGRDARALATDGQAAPANPYPRQSLSHRVT